MIFDLPQRNKETGRPYISYTQYSSWKAIKSFNLKIPGNQEYILKYFLGCNWKDQGWAQFGKEVEAYIRDKKTFSSSFTVKEKAVLDQIYFKGEEKKFVLNLGDFDLYGIIDDALDDDSYYCDCKTGSKSSLERYYKPEYNQLDIYALYALQKTGKIPLLEVLAIERAGNCMFGKGRKALTVGKNHFYIPRTTTIERLNEIKADIISVANEISEHYKLFKLVNI